ncbi:nitric oxide synthase-related protein [Babesia gibsoni]|uniref:Nitric oxide synthase-related protein n=1 Tax=Babesia gibsoni TaxID=33632 RepID=A0AAD8LR78_BABGI|nr:nitric oxide synthase-related protein [Babesia gibsoni]
MLIVYATETGSAEGLAYSIYLELYLRGIDVFVTNSCMVTPHVLNYHDRIIFIVSTAAYGEFPHSAHKLVSDLRGLKTRVKWSYTLFGLGDSRYPLFNHAARKLVTILDVIGAAQFHRVAYGDEQHPLGYLGEFITWFSDFKDQLKLGDVQNAGPLQFDLSVEKLGMEAKEGNIKVKCLTGQVISNDVITSEDHFRNVRNIVIHCNGGKYTTGDICCIYPTGHPEAVRHSLIKLGFNPEETIILHRRKNGCISFSNTSVVFHGNEKQKQMDEGLLPYEGKNISLTTLFSDFLSLSNLCCQWQMYVMSIFAEMEIHKTKLLEMSSFTIEGCAEYNRYCKDERRSLYEVLCDFNSVKLPLYVLINIATPYYPRLYSIASTHNTLGIGRPEPSVFDGSLSSVSYKSFKAFLKQERKRNGLMELCVSEVTHNTPYGRKIEGQASELLANAVPRQLLRFDIIKSGVAPAVLDLSVPVLFICTGTGLAAVKPLLEGRMERFMQLWNEHFRLPNVRDIAFFGFRRKRQDHLYLGDMRLLKMWCDIVFVYSRESGKKVYVQDVISQFPKRVIEILMKGLVFISGRSHPMPKQVIETLSDILVTGAGFGKRAADKFVESALLGGKIIVDTWG